MLNRELNNFFMAVVDTKQARHTGVCRACLVPLTGVEPVRYFYRGILSPLCLPIPPQRHRMGRGKSTPHIIAFFQSFVKSS